MTSAQVIKATSYQNVCDCLQAAGHTKQRLQLYRPTARPDVTRLDLTSLNELLEIDQDNLVATVQAGLSLKQLSSALGARGLRFIPADSPFYHHLTVGEWVYQGCPNPSSWKYGPGKHTLMGTTYILPSGQSIQTGGKTVKNVTGYDFTRFLSGGACNLGVGVQFQLKLLPQPEYRLSGQAYFSSLQQAFDFIEMLRRHPVAPAFLLAADQITQQILQAESPPHAVVVEFELDGVKEEVENFAETIINNAPDNCCQLHQTPAASMLAPVFAVAGTIGICDEWKLPYNCQLNALSKLAKHYPTIGWFGQWAEGKVHALLSDQQTTSTLIDQISQLVVQEHGAASSMFQRQRGNIPHSPLAQFESNLCQTLDPHGILTWREDAL